MPIAPVPSRVGRPLGSDPSSQHCRLSARIATSVVRSEMARQLRGELIRAKDPSGPARGRWTRFAKPPDGASSESAPGQCCSHIGTSRDAACRRRPSKTPDSESHRRPGTLEVGSTVWRALTSCLTECGTIIMISSSPASCAARVVPRASPWMMAPDHMPDRDWSPFWAMFRRRLAGFRSHDRTCLGRGAPCRGRCSGAVVAMEVVPGRTRPPLIAPS
jgi:hypothetical protein